MKRMGISLFPLLCLLLIPGMSMVSSLRRPPHLHYSAPTQSRHNVVNSSSISFKTFYIKQQLDHFGFASSKTFQQRYLVADQFWNRNEGPIFFYTGNEGDIELFCNNTGFMWDIAPEFRAMLVFAEHRYYGKSLPFGPDTYKNVTNLNYFTSEQALADYAELIRYLKATVPGAADSPVVAFGGSYGGMLAAWMRIKYPNSVIGALAASAPVWQFTGITPCNRFYDIVSATFEKASGTCVKNIHNAYDALDSVAQQAGGFDFLSKAFRTCKPFTSTDDVYNFKSMLVGMYVNYAMVDYPYPANFIANLPGWPVKVACSFLSSPLQGESLIEGIAKMTNVYYNYTGDLPCLGIFGGDDQLKNNGGLGLQGWYYQSCTEMVMPLCSNNTGLFYEVPWNFQQVSDGCYAMFKTRPRQDWISLEYWGKSLKAASNIIFSNGDLDPWSGGGVTQTQSNSVIAILIENGAHHLDLRGKHDLDPPSVRNAREQEKNIIRKWLGLTP